MKTTQVRDVVLQKAPVACTEYSWKRLHVGHTKETLVLIGRRGTGLPWKQTALPPWQMVVVMVSGAGCSDGGIPR